MAVRNFDGVDDTIVWSTGGLSGMTFGTFAAIVKHDNLAGLFQGWCGLHDSGGTGTALFYADADSPGMHHPPTGSQLATGFVITTGTWWLVVYRKATGTTTGRFSAYNFTSQTWSHGAGSAPALPNWTAPGATGSIKNNFNATNFLDGKMAVRAAWANALPWSADATGDAALIAAGLHISGQNWFVLGTSALWAYNQETTAEPVQDLIGSAHQTSITGTDVITGDDPPAFDFTFTSTTVYSRPIRAGRIGPDRRVHLPGRRFDFGAESVDTTGTLAVTQEDDTMAASGTVIGVPVPLPVVAITAADRAAQLLRRQPNPAFIELGSAAIVGNAGFVEVTQAAQTMAASGTAVPPPIVIPIVATATAKAEAQRRYRQPALTLSSRPSVVVGDITGTVAVSQADQTMAAPGTVHPVGSLAVTQADQTMAASGVLGYSGTLVVTQADQTMAAAGTVSGDAISGSVAVTQANQTMASVGFLGDIVVLSGFQLLVPASHQVGAVGTNQTEADGTDFGLIVLPGSHLVEADE